MSSTLKEQLQAIFRPALQEELDLTNAKARRYENMLAHLERSGPQVFGVTVFAPNEEGRSFSLIEPGELADLIRKAKAGFAELNGSLKIQASYSVMLFLDDQLHPIFSDRVKVDEKFWRSFI